MQPSVYVIILNWNRLKEITACINAVQASTYTAVNIIIVDNNSSDGSPHILRQKFQDIHIIHNSANLGFTGGNNEGIKYAMQKKADYIWLLNNDAICREDTIEKMVKYMQDNPSAGLLSPVIKYLKNGREVSYFGTYLNKVSFTSKLIHSGEELHSISNNEPQNICLWGTALLIRGVFTSQLGLLDDDFFAYWEDCDYSLRSIDHGYTNHMLDATSVFHGLQGAQESPPSESFFYYMIRNEFLFWNKHSSFLKSLLKKNTIIAKSLSKLGNSRKYNNSTLTEACLEGLIAGILGRKGKRTPLPNLLKIILRPVAAHPYFYSAIVNLKPFSLFRNKT